MKLSFRWYGKDDPVKIQYIKHIPPVKSIVSAVYSVKPGLIWPQNDINEIKTIVNSNGLDFDVVESIPIHEDIKLMRGDFLKHIANYQENIRRVAKAGVKVICYNFMPVFDWLRTNLDYKLEDKSSALAYFNDDFAKLDPTKLALPGWDSSYDVNQIKELISAYITRGHSGLWESITYFLKQVIPVAAAHHVKMAIHPDDPPWDVFKIPRIITNQANLDKFLKIVDTPYHGLTLCCGSLGCDPKNDMPTLLARYVKQNRVHFVHLRNIKILADGSFYESGHISKNGSLDFDKLVKILAENDYKGYVRPDHGRFIWGETGKPGYGLYDRALGIMYIYGLWEAHRKALNKSLEVN